jgi:cation-transporting ATPase 13A1
VAYKTLKSTTDTATKLTRQEAECDLLFAGFLVFDSDLKADSKGVIKELQGAKQNVVMITGDSVYTAVSVGKRLMIIERSKKSPPTLLLLCLETTENSGKSGSSKSKSTSVEKVWRRIDAKTTSNEDPLATSHRQVDDIDFDLTNLDSLAKDNSLCVIGSTLDIIAAQSKHHFSSVLKVLVPHVKIFARVSPQQKEKIILAFNESGHFTLMCGDGTNDVGALKAAHVGVSIINNPKLESKVEKNGSGEGSKKGGGSSVKDRAARALMELQENEQDPSLVKLGDASIASPFTTKRTSVDSVLAIIRQGRCTLVTTIQVYKVLALNCLASAYMMSSLYMKGLKQGDMQMTASGILIAALFFFLSQAKPLLTVSDHAPPSSVFNPAVYLSIIGQCLVHLACMAATVMLCEQYTLAQSFSMSPDGKFTPNLINSTMFILANLMQVNNFWVNYRGAPFMEPLTSNVYYYRSLQAVYVIALIVIGGQFEPANDFLQLVMLPAVPDFQVKFLGILGADALLAFGIEHACRRLE